MRLRLALVGAFLLFTGLPATPALAHAELGHTTPVAGAQIAVPPPELRLGFSEQLGPESRVSLVDGCRRHVGRTATVRGAGLVVPVRGGQPGTWQVRYDVVSADDGHASSGRYSFTVAGTARCAVGGAAVDVSPGLPDLGAGGDGQLVASLLATGAFVAAGLFVRRRTAPAS